MRFVLPAALAVALITGAGGLEEQQNGTPQ